MQVREMKSGDIAACADILCSVYNNDLWQNRWERSAAIEYLTDFFCAPKFLGYVAEEKGTILGAIFAREKVWWSGSEVYVEELFVSPAHQGKGCGARLLGQAERYVREKGLAGMTLTTNRNVPARQFYQKQGFTECSHVVFLCKEMK